jgi:hydrophobe/amphiphile efflux-1 (HAE1) family protein
MSLWEYSVRRPVFAWMFMLGLIVFGYYSYTRLGISQNPDVDIPVVNISIGWEGAAPEIIELDVIDPVEGQLSTISGVKALRSNSRRGVANITVEFDIKKDIDLAVQEVQAKILQAQRSLPKDIEAPIITKVNPEDQPIFWVSVTAKDVSRRDLMVFVRDKIKDRFTSVEGVSDIILGGYVEPNLRIYPKLPELNRLDLTPLDIFNAIETEQKELPGGSLNSNNKELIVRTLGEVDTPEEFQKISINRRGGTPNFTPVNVGDVAQVELGLADVQRLSRVNGISSLGLGIRKQRGSNAVEVGNRVKARIEEVKKQLPPQYDIGINFDGTKFIEESIHELKFTTFICALMTALVVWFFLRTFNSTLNITLSIPTVIFATFLSMDLFGFTLNTFSMMALTLAVGMIVDDNIMVLENINRWYGITKDWKEAAIKGTSEIFGAVLATSIAVVAIFLPIGYMSGVIGLFFYQFAIVLSAAIFFSTLDALIFTPMRASRLQGQASAKEIEILNKFKIWQDRYLKGLTVALQHPKKVLIFSLMGITIFSALCFKLLKKEFLPAQDQSILMLMAKTPPGSSLQFTDEKVAEIEKILLNMPHIKRYFVSIGGFQGNEPNNAFAYVTLQDIGERPALGKHKKPTHLDIADFLRSEIKEKVKGIFVIVQDPSSRGFSQGRGQGAEVEFKVTGPDWNVLTGLIDQYKTLFENSKKVKDIDSNYKGLIQELRIIPDRNKMMQRGVSVDDLAKTVQATISGTVAAKMSSGGRRFDVRIKLSEEDLKDKNIVTQIPIRNNRGQTIKLGEVAIIEEQPGLLSTIREDRERALNVFAVRENTKESLDLVMNSLKTEMLKILPQGYVLSESGASKDFKSSGADFLITFLLGILISYMVLGAQFNSFMAPLLILLALPFSIGGALLSLLATDISLNLYSAIGMILLAGIVKKNSIMIVEFANQVREKDHLNSLDALLKACPLRLRPIMMTTITTIAGTLPAALSLGPGAESRIPLAVTVIGGLILSTALTLYVVPCAYLIAYKNK